MIHGCHPYPWTLVHHPWIFTWMDLGPSMVVPNLEDWEPPFSPIEIHEFCKVNNWVFAFPPPNGWDPECVCVWGGWHCLLVGDLAVCVGGGFDCVCRRGLWLSTRSYGPHRPLWWIDASQLCWETLMDGGWGHVSYVWLGYPCLGGVCWQGTRCAVELLGATYHVYETTKLTAVKVRRERENNDKECNTVVYICI